MLVVIGGGQVGCYHTRQLLKALRAGRLPGERLLVVDRNHRCPATCVEPAHCPALHAARDWDLGDLIEAEAQARGYRPAIFRLRHLGGGVAGISLRDVRALRAPLGRMAQGRGLVATSSRCHAAVNAIQIFTFAP